MVSNVFERTGDTRIMAAVNVSPESFFSGSVSTGARAIADQVRRAEAEGALLIDIGAKSTAPYKETQIAEDEEVARMSAAIRAARAATSLPISADTQSAAVARAALDEGADIINDVSALLHDPAMATVCAAAGGVILMANGEYVEDWSGAEDDPATFVGGLLAAAISRALEAGISRDRIMVDIGLGFFRKAPMDWAEWDLALLRGLAQAGWLDAPVLVGASRKSFLGKLLGDRPPEDRLAGSLAVAAWAARHKVDWLRIHDVAETADVIKVIQLLENGVAE